MVRTATKLPKKNNAADGQKAHLDEKCYKVGRIRYNSWASAVLKSCDIVIYERELVHIQNYHGKELAEFGMTPLDFVKFVVSNFNEIYKGSGVSILLVVKHTNLSKVAAIELVVLDKKQSYKIKTANPIKTERLLSKKLLCTNIAH